MNHNKVPQLEQHFCLTDNNNNNDNYNNNTQFTIIETIEKMIKFYINTRSG